jgi:sugar/nucleoside kinase (ribokinase family)
MLFDVICAGQAMWSFAAIPGKPVVKPNGGVVHIAIDLAKKLRVGLATTLWDDRFGRTLKRKVAAAGVDVRGVQLASQTTLVLVEGTTGQLVTHRDEDRTVEIPSDWSSQVLLLSGLTPVVSHTASLCRAARAARRAGSSVVLDINAQWQTWAGHDPRAMRMLLRESDVVHCSTEDLFILDIDISALRAALRPSATIVVSTTQAVTAMGTFGETTSKPRKRDATTASICAALARVSPGSPMDPLFLTRS